MDGNRDIGMGRRGFGGDIWKSGRKSEIDKRVLILLGNSGGRTRGF
jgi:hypothetical protein